MAYLYPVHAQVSQVESQVADQFEGVSSKGYGRSSKVSSRLTSRDKERVRLAELKPERSMLKQKRSSKLQKKIQKLFTQEKMQSCGGSHPSALHIDAFQPPIKESDNSVKKDNDKASDNTSSNVRSASCHATRPTQSTILHTILPVQVKSPCVKKGLQRNCEKYV